MYIILFSAIMSKHQRTYNSWQSMKQRCLNPNNPNWGIYGAAGIVITSRWINSYDTFITDMGPRPANHSIDRINPFGDYEPTNCRWATPKQQANNTRKGYFLKEQKRRQLEFELQYKFDF